MATPNASKEGPSGERSRKKSPPLDAKPIEQLLSNSPKKSAIDGPYILSKARDFKHLNESAPDTSIEDYYECVEPLEAYKQRKPTKRPKLKK